MTSSVLRRNQLIRLKESRGGKCTMCGYDKNYACLDFHHMDPSTKSFGVNTASMNTFGMEICQKEAEKCVLLCRNCHSDLHYPDTRKTETQITDFTITPRVVKPTGTQLGTAFCPVCFEHKNVSKFELAGDGVSRFGICTKCLASPNDLTMETCNIFYHLW